MDEIERLPLIKDREFNKDYLHKNIIVYQVENEGYFRCKKHKQRFNRCKICYNKEWKYDGDINEIHLLPRFKIDRKTDTLYRTNEGIIVYVENNKVKCKLHDKNTIYCKICFPKKEVNNIVRNIVTINIDINNIVIEELPNIQKIKKDKRETDTLYNYKNKVVLWNNKYIICYEHNKRFCECNLCYKEPKKIRKKLEFKINEVDKLNLPKYPLEVKNRKENTDYILNEIIVNWNFEKQISICKKHKIRSDICTKCYKKLIKDNNIQLKNNNIEGVLKLPENIDDRDLETIYVYRDILVKWQQNRIKCNEHNKCFNECIICYNLKTSSKEVDYGDDIDIDFIEDLPNNIEDRILDTMYIYNNKIRLWTEKGLKCFHNKEYNRCNICSNNKCIHNKIKENCKFCGNNICEHNLWKSNCRICKPQFFCIHNKKKELCGICGGSQICKEHGNNKSICIKCGTGGSLCIHKKRKQYCSICNLKYYCEHNKVKHYCKLCGNSHCEHGIFKRRCKFCNFNGYIKHIVSVRLRLCVKNKRYRSLKYLDCNIEIFKEYIKKQFQEGMTWDNHGKWHIDHIRSCASFDFSNEEEICMCFHYTNLQPLWASENISKGDKYNPSTFHRIWTGNEWVNKN